MAYKGKYKIKNPDKYIGDADAVVYRSSWERAAFVWCEQNDTIVAWSSEEIIIRYLSKVDNKIHRYYPDLFIEFSNGNKILVEIKPKKQTEPPVRSETGKGKNKYIGEAITYVKNVSKWEAADEFCKKNGMIFEIWDEHKLKALGMKIIGRTTGSFVHPSKRRRRKQKTATKPPSVEGNK